MVFLQRKSIAYLKLQDEFRTNLQLLVKALLCIIGKFEGEFVGDCLFKQQGEQEA